MNNLSFYYRDSLDLKHLFQTASRFALDLPNGNLIIENGRLFLKNPQLLTPQDIHNKIYIYNQGGISSEVEVNVRCWKEDDLYLKEVTKFFRLKKSRFYRKIHSGIRKVFRTGYDSILLTKDGVTYYIQGGKLMWKTKENKGVLSNRIHLSQPYYNQMIKEGILGFIRTGTKIYASLDGLRNWEVIHLGTYALGKSMIWDKESNSLIFSNYTGGDIRVRHYLRRYNVNTKVTDTLLTFYTTEEHKTLGLSPFARHIHIISVDPYTGDWYIAVGDYGEEPAIYRSTNRGKSFEKVGGGKQMWRTLSFIFRKDYILWGSDSESPQYLSRINRSQLNSLPIKDEDVVRYPLFNGALWFTYDDGDIVIMTSNSEGHYYDDCHRVYGIVIDNDGTPDVYSLFQERSDPQKNRFVFNQLFFLGKDENNNFWFYDNQNKVNRQFILQKREN